MNATVLCLTPNVVTFKDLEIDVKVINIQSHIENHYRISSKNGPNDILAKIVKIPLTNVRGILFYLSLEYLKEQQEIAKLLKNYYEKHNIPLFCCSQDSIYYSSILLAYVDEYGENVITDSQTLLTIYDDHLYGFQTSVNSIAVKKCKDYYYFNDIKKIDRLDYTDDELKKIVTTPEILIYFNGPYYRANDHQKKTFDSICSKLKGYNIRILKKDNKSYENSAIVGKILKHIGEKSFKYEFASLTYVKFFLGASVGWMDNDPDPETIRFHEHSLICVNEFEVIPAKKTIVFYETFKKIVCTNSSGFKYENTETPSVPELGLAAFFTVDTFYIPRVIVHQPKEVVDGVVIIQFDSAKMSVEIVKNGKLESIGLNKVPLMISFANNKVECGEEALKVKETQNTFVVTDLLTIAAFPNDVSHQPEWGFKVVNGLLQFDTFRGRRKSTISFLFALIIKWAIVNAEEHFGMMPKIAVIVADRLRSPLKDVLKKACEETKLENIDMQVHQYKIVEIRDK